MSLLRDMGLRQFEWDKNEGDTPFGSANAAIDRHNREIEAAFWKGFNHAIEQGSARAEIVTNRLYYTQKDGCKHDDSGCGRICYNCVEEAIGLALLEPKVSLEPSRTPGDGDLNKACQDFADAFFRLGRAQSKTAQSYFSMNPRGLTK